MDAGLLVIVALFVVFWLLLIRPQRRRQRAQDEMVANLRVGDEIVTAGGLYGDITAIEGDEVYVEIAEGVEVRVARRAIAGVMPDDEDEEPDEEPGAEEDAGLDDERPPEAEGASKTVDER
ncbi:MAG: preprotein translocase subunit YajC [Actinomycetota bacterium]|nr:preprotein translocase subunit YajC [Actinomycetota bacterium]